MLRDVDLDRFWADNDVALRDPFAPDIPQFPLGIAMFTGCLCGSYLGAHYSDRIGNLWIRRFFLTVLTIMILKMAFRL